jgi:hypothetical protein
MNRSHLCLPCHCSITAFNIDDILPERGCAHTTQSYFKAYIMNLFKLTKAMAILLGIVVEQGFANMEVKHLHVRSQKVHQLVKEIAQSSSMSFSGSSLNFEGIDAGIITTLTKSTKAGKMSKTTSPTSSPISKPTSSPSKKDN